MPTTTIECANPIHEEPFLVSEKDSPYTCKFSEIPEIISGARDVLVESSSENKAEPENPEFKLPSRRSLFIIITGNALFQFSFYVVISSASVYAELLGGSAIFSGVVIGIPTLFSGIALFFMSKLDRGQYATPLRISYTTMFLGNILYGLAYRARHLYLILIGRIVSGFGYISFMYSKRYCSDPRIVGIRRRTTLASWLVVGQGFGFSAGPFVGGLLYKTGFHSSIFNGVTSPGWVMAVVWLLFWSLSYILFQDVPKRPEPERIKLPSSTPSPQTTAATGPALTVSPQQWGVIICMCYYSMTCFFILGSWEANIPIFTAEALGYSPYRAGNFIALGGISSFPFLLLNVRYAGRVQDRTTLATGTTLGLVGLLTAMAILHLQKVTFGSLLACWFLIALGFNLASTCTLSLLSKQLPDTWNNRVSMAIQYSNNTGRVTGAILGGAGVKIGMMNYVGIQIAVVGLGGVMYLTLWRQLKAKTG